MAAQAGGLVIEFGMASKVPNKNVFEEARAEAFPNGRCDRRAGAFFPIQVQHRVVNVPLQRDPAFGMRQRPVFGSVGRKLMQRETVRARAWERP